MKYLVNRYWEVSDTVTVTADSEEDAVDKACALPLSPDPEYVSDSINSDSDADVEEI
jgi:hypothetical protein